MKGIRIRPEQDGLRTSLFDLEAEIMELVWDEAWTEFAVSDVHSALERRRDVAYTTIMTTVSRLFDKELLARHKVGRKYVYEVRLTRPEFIDAMTREVLHCLPPVSSEAALAMLVERVSEADDAELERLEVMIRERRKANDG